MANGRAEMAVRDVKRQCRTLRNSAEQNTSVRISDDSPLLSWLFRFTARVMDKMTIGKDGKTSEMRKTCRRWIKPTSVERNFGFVKLEETVSVLLQVAWLKGSFVGHHDRNRAVLCITKNGVVRGKSWTRQTLSDAWELAYWEGMCGTPWQIVAPESKLTKKVTAEDCG